MVRSTAFLFSCSQENTKIASAIPSLIQMKSDGRCAGLFQGTCKATSVTATPTFAKLWHLSKLFRAQQRAKGAKSTCAPQLRESSSPKLGAFFRRPNLTPTYSRFFFKPSEGKDWKTICQFTGFPCL